MKVTLDKKQGNMYGNPIPERCELIGMVETENRKGALVRFWDTGILCQVNAGVVRSMPQSKVVSAEMQARQDQRDVAGLGRFYDDKWLNDWAEKNGGAVYGEETMLGYLDEAKDLAESTGESLESAFSRVIGVSVGE